MNKKIIICGSILTFLACLFPPQKDCYNIHKCFYSGLRFLFSHSNEVDYTAIYYELLTIEIIAILILTFGIAYYMKEK